jgi:acetolactate synthase-1/2/3 large subunit
MGRARLTLTVRTRNPDNPRSFVKNPRISENTNVTDANELNGAKLLVERLKAEGCEALFGYPGGVVIPIFDVLHDEKDLKFILVRHEQAAAHAADGYARATGKVGCCLATSGPGATNLVTGIATAYMDSIPMVAITGQVKTALIGNDAFQEADVTGITRPITKHNYLVKDVKDLPRVLKEAFHIASTGRPGPVVIDIPVDVSTAMTTLPGEIAMDLPGYNPTIEGNPRQIERAAKVINDSERPVIIGGGGTLSSGASSELRALARNGNIPITTTLMGLGTFPEDDPLSLHMLGMHGTVYANIAIQKADLLISVGARFDDRITGKMDQFAERAKIVHIDIDPSAISKSIKVDVPIVGDAKKILQKLLPQIQHKERAEWHAFVAERKRKHELTYTKDGKLRPQFVVEKIHDVTDGKAVIATEVGQNQMWAAQYYGYTEPRSWLSSGGLGTMGYGLPAAIGAKVGRPDKLVIDIAGDGSIQMNSQELATAVCNNIPVKVCILNNGYLGMVRQWQERFWNRRYSHTNICGTPDFVKLAEAYGALGLRVTEKDEVEAALRQAFEDPRPAVIDFMVEPEENVAPMVPAGAPIDEFELV